MTKPKEEKKKIDEMALKMNDKLRELFKEVYKQIGINNETKKSKRSA
jgi:hypothetical protein